MFSLLGPATQRAGHSVNSLHANKTKMIRNITEAMIDSNYGEHNDLTDHNTMKALTDIKSNLIILSKSA